jgi:hypothetical protein
MFQQLIAIIRGLYYLRRYSRNICVVDVYGLKFVHCGQLSTKSFGRIPRPLATLDKL